MPRLCGKCAIEPAMQGDGWKLSICKKCHNEYQKERRKKNPSKHNQWAAERRRGVIEHYGGKCSCCGESEYAFLAIDHKLDNGSTERRKYKGALWKLAIKRGLPNDYQILCHNCNLAKSIYGSCPHQKDDGGERP